MGVRLDSTAPVPPFTLSVLFFPWWVPLKTPGIVPSLAEGIPVTDGPGSYKNSLEKSWATCFRVSEFGMYTGPRAGSAHNCLVSSISRVFLLINSSICYFFWALSLSISAAIWVFVRVTSDPLSLLSGCFLGSFLWASFFFWPPTLRVLTRFGIAHLDRLMVFLGYVRNAGTHYNYCSIITNICFLFPF